MRWLRRFFHRFNKSTGDPMAEPIVNVKIHETLFYHESPLLNALTALQIKVSIHDGDIDVVEITPSVGLFRLCINELDSETLSDFIERIKRFHKHYSQQIIIAEGYGNEDRSIDPLLIAGFMILIVQQEKVGITPPAMLPTRHYVFGVWRCANKLKTEPQLWDAPNPILPRLKMPNCS